MNVVATPRQIESARRNGAQSKGPITPEGKAKSSLNALKHGLAADPEILLETENNDNYDRLLEAYIDAYQPAAGDEYDLVCQIVSASWRLRRIGRIEVCLMEDQMTSSARLLDIMDRPGPTPVLQAQAFRSLACSGRSVDLVIRYTSMARRCYDTALKTLRDLQRERRKLEKQNEPDFAKVPAKSTAPQTEIAAVSVERKQGLKPVTVFPAPAPQASDPKPHSPLCEPQPLPEPVQIDSPKQAQC